MTPPDLPHAIHLLPHGKETKMLCGQVEWHQAAGTDYPEAVTCEQCRQVMDQQAPEENDRPNKPQSAS